MDLGNLLNAIGITASGAMPVIQQNNAQRTAAQRLGQLAQAAQMNQPGFSTYPSANTGTPLPNGMPVGSPPPVGGAPGGAPNPMGNMMPPMAGGALPVTPYGGPTTSPSGDPFSYPNIINAFFGPNGGQSSTDFMAWQDAEKTLRPYGQIQGRQQVEGQREQNREKLEDKKQGGRLELLQQKNAVIMRGQDKNYQARLASLAARATPQQQQAFKAAQVEFQQASMNYRNAKLSMSSTPEEINALADKAVAAQQKMEAVVGQQAGGGDAPAADTTLPAAKEKIKPGEEVRYDAQGVAYVNRNGQAVPAEQ